MVKHLTVKMLRDIRRSLSSYVVAAVVVAVGFAGYSVISSAAEQLERSKQFFFEETRFCGGFAEVQEAPVAVARKLEQIDGVRSAQGRLVANVRATGLAQDTEFKLISFTEDGMNRPMLSRGMLPLPGSRQLILGDGGANGNGLAPGDTVRLALGGQEFTYAISGTGLSPENIYLVKSINELLPTPAAYDAAYLQYDDLARLLSKPGKANNFVFTLENGVELPQVQAQVEALLEPYGCYRVYESADELSVSVLEMELEQLGRVTAVIPLMFLSIAAIILYITLHRLIDQQRTQIGTLMALGVSNRTILLHYTGYGAIVGLGGGLAGGVYGSLAAGPMSDFYRVYFSLPKVPLSVSPRYLLVGAAVATLFCAAVSALSVRHCIRLAPAQALRPAPPQKARRLFLERFPGFVRLLTVPGLMAVRSLARNPRRTLLSLLGIASAYMITATLVSMNSMFDVFLFDYLEQNQRQDVSVAFASPVAAADALRAVRGEGIERLEGIVELPVKLRGKTGELDGVVQGIAPDSQLCRLYDLNDRPVAVQPEGIVLSVHMAGRLGVKRGDTVEVEVLYPEKRVSQIRVTDLMAQYLGSNAYMSLEGVGQISEYRDVYTSVLLKAPADARERLLRLLDGAAQVTTVQTRQQRVDQYRGMMGNIGGIMAAMAAMGVLIGMAVVYVSSLISFEELKREIAVLRMLGLDDRECMQTISLGQWLLGLGSVLPGVPLTLLMSRLISESMSLELFSIPNFVDGWSLLGSVGLLAVAVAWSNRILFRKLKRSTPVELLRERE